MTLSTSDTSKSTKTALIYLLISIFCGLFGAVYELFSHGVYSYYMIYAFAFPLVGGTLPFLIFSVFGRIRLPGVLAQRLYHSGIAAFTVGSMIQGVLEIYGTTNALTVWYWIAGTALIGTAILTHFACHPDH